MRKLIALQIALRQNFSLSELAGVCFSAGFDPEDIPGKDLGKPAWTREITRYARQGQRLASLLAALEKERPDIHWTALADESGKDALSPYPGLLAFDQKNAELFFGRNEEIQEIADFVSRRGFLCLYGPSGCGKSSLLRAGVVPALAEGAGVNSEGWRVADIPPTSEGARQLSQYALAANLAPGSARALFLIDQFEQVFASDNEALVKSFTQSVCLLAKQKFSSVILAIRADFIGRVMDSDLWPLAEGGAHLPLAPLRGDSLRKAIREPALAAGAQLDEALVERLASETENQPGATPFLQETLRMLWDKADGDSIKLADYERLGRNGRPGLAASVENVAESALQALPQADWPAARRLLLELVQLGQPGHTPDIRRVLALDEARSKFGSSASFGSILETLTHHRVITQDSQMVNGAAGETLSLSHDTLISNWTRLREWLNQDRARLSSMRDLDEAVKEWQARKGEEGALITGSRLREWQTCARDPLLALSANEAEFLQKCALLERRRERAAYLGQTAGAAIGSGLGFGIAFAVPAASSSQLTIFSLMFSAGSLCGLGLGLGLWLGRGNRVKSVVISVVLSAPGSALAFAIYEGGFRRALDWNKLLLTGALGMAIALSSCVFSARLFRMASAALLTAIVFTAINPPLQGLSTPPATLMVMGGLLGVATLIGLDLTKAEKSEKGAL